MKRGMTADEIALARKWLGAVDVNATPDRTIDDVVNGTLTHERIRLRLAWDRFTAAVRKAIFGGLFE